MKVRPVSNTKKPLTRPFALVSGKVLVKKQQVRVIPAKAGTQGKERFTLLFHPKSFNFIRKQPVFFFHKITPRFPLSRE